MSKELTFTIAEISKLNLQPGDILSVKMVGEEFDENAMKSLKAQFSAIFPNNRVSIMVLPPNHDVQMTVIKAAIEPVEASDCAKPTSYCDSCACGKKERIEGEIKISEARARLEKHLEGRGSPELKKLAEQAHEPSVQTEQLEHLTHQDAGPIDVTQSIESLIADLDKRINLGSFKPDQE